MTTDKKRPTKYITLSYMSQSDARKPRIVRLMVQDDSFGIETIAEMTEHEFVLFMSGQCVKMECER